MDFIKTIVYSTWIRVGLWIVIGIGVNTAPPHYPTFSGNFGWSVELHSLVQYIVSVGLWPLSLWTPTFTVGKWTGL
jgi:hypothetical protein